RLRRIEVSASVRRIGIPALEDAVRQIPNVLSRSDVVLVRTVSPGNAGHAGPVVPKEPVLDCPTHAEALSIIEVVGTSLGLDDPGKGIDVLLGRQARRLRLNGD